MDVLGVDSIHWTDAMPAEGLSIRRVVRNPEENPTVYWSHHPIQILMFFLGASSSKTTQR